MIIVGLDPGTTTGLASWSTTGMCFGDVTSMAIHKAMDYIRSLPQHPGELLVIFEDARLIRVRGGNTFGDVDRLQGVGSVKRDCSIWEGFLRDHGIPFITQRKGRTKRNADEFHRLTGWTGRTNEHGRDAGLIVFGIDARRAAVLLDTGRRAA